MNVYHHSKIVRVVSIQSKNGEPVLDYAIGDNVEAFLKTDVSSDGRLIFYTEVIKGTVDNIFYCGNDIHVSVNKHVVAEIHKDYAILFTRHFNIPIKNN